jgi:hypothetical protein
MTACGVINNNLYDMHYRYNFDAYVFCANLFSNEIYQFIQDYCNDCQILLYHPKLIDYNILSISENIRHISHAPDNQCITIPRLVNTNIFYNTNETKSNNMLCFLDGYQKIPNELYNIVYPNSDMNIQIFSKSMRHQQNFGYLSEKDKAILLNQSKAYLDIDGLYTIEAMLCGSKILSINSQGSAIEDNNMIMPEHSTYLEFIESVIK